MIQRSETGAGQDAGGTPPASLGFWGRLLNWVRKLAFALLLIGFLWLCGAAFWYHAEITRLSSTSSDTLPKKETFTRDEVLQHIGFTCGLFRAHAPWMITPAGIMLIAGLTLGFTRRRAKQPPAD